MPGSSTELAPTGWIDSIGLIGPALPDWATARRLLADAGDYTAAPTVVALPPILPPAERRRTSLAVRVALASGHEAIRQASFGAERLHSVFASSGGDGNTCHQICEALASADRRVSPTHFHNSVHNAPSGYWGIAMHATARSTSICAHDASFGAGLIDAIALLAELSEPVLLVAYDAPYPEPLVHCRPIADAMGVAMVLAPQPTRPGAIGISLALAPGEPTPAAHPALEAMRHSIPTARALPLLASIARGVAGTVVLDYLAPVDAAASPLRLHALLARAPAHDEAAA